MVDDDIIVVVDVDAVVVVVVAMQAVVIVTKAIRKRVIFSGIFGVFITGALLTPPPFCLALLPAQTMHYVHHAFGAYLW